MSLPVLLGRVKSGAILPIAGAESTRVHGHFATEDEQMSVTGIFCSLLYRSCADCSFPTGLPSKGSS